jgi:transcriptional regulator with XRE-family HTH domain
MTFASDSDDGGFSQEVLAVDAGIDRTYVSRLERGLENPTVAVVERLAKALSANIEELFKVPRPGQPAPRPLMDGGQRAIRTGMEGTFGAIWKSAVAPKAEVHRSRRHFRKVPLTEVSQPNFITDLVRNRTEGDTTSSIAGLP